MDMPTRDFHADCAPTSADALRNLELTRIFGGLDAEGCARAADATWGLALSGGGIRSATFGLGVLQGLARCGWLDAFHYMSTVSGGGYVGGYLQAMLHRCGLQAALDGLRANEGDDGTGEAAASASIGDLRRYSNFLSPDKAALSADSVSMVTTYVGNMLLTLIQLCALLVLVALVPMAGYAGVVALQGLLGVAVVLGASLLALAMLLRASLHRLREADCDVGTWRGRATRSLNLATARRLAVAGLVAGFVALSVWLFAAPAPATACATTRLAGFWCTPGLELRAAGVGAAYALGFVVWLYGWCQRAAVTQDRFGKRLLRHVAGGAAGTVLVAVLAAYAAGVQAEWASGMFTTPLWSDPWIVLAFGTPVVFVAYFLASLVTLAIGYMPGDTLPRERWARLMGVCGVATLLALTLPIVLLVMVEPAWHGATGLLRSTTGLDWGWLEWAVPIATALLSGAGARAAYSAEAVDFRAPPTRMRRALNLFIALAPWLLVASVFALAGIATRHLLATPWWTAGPTFDMTGYPPMSLGWVVSVLAIAAAAWWLSAHLDENEFSMNGFYRNRLVRCYLAPARAGMQRDPETGLDPDGDDLPVADLLDLLPEERAPRDGATPTGRPLYPLFCAAVNLVKSDRLDWQDRKAASFVFTPMFCGHQPVDRTDAPIGDRACDPHAWHDDHVIGSMPRSELARTMTLGAAMSVSGAAVSPNMGYHSSPPVAFLLTLFNARLGWWIENHNAPRTTTYFAGLNLLSELISNTHAHSRYVHVSDGGHFENLGLYELVRRRCRFILSVDASADPDRDFEGLGNAVQKCRVDFGAHIELDTSVLRPDRVTGRARRCATLGKVTYADGAQGVILYLKPTLTGAEATDIRHYASAHPAFPHEPTSDQFFDEQQFECYRRLGLESLLRVFDAVGERPASLTARAQGVHRSESARETLLRALKYRFYEPVDATALHFSQHGKAMAHLLQTLRTTPALACLDAQAFPGLHAPIATDCTGMGHVPPEHFRACFYFVQEMMQLMENVYVDLELESNWTHPDNRGWVNQFRHWMKIPMFRLAWSLTLQTRGARFVRFCETRLGMPRFAEGLDVDWHAGDSTDGFARCIDTLVEAGRLTAAETSLLRSPAVQAQLLGVRWSLGLLYFNGVAFGLPIAGGDVVETPDTRGATAERAGPHDKAVGLGIALTTGRDLQGGRGEHLAVLRVRDHLRKLGLADIAVQRIVQTKGRCDWTARIAPGVYGRHAGRISPACAERQTSTLAGMLTRALRAYMPPVDVERRAAPRAQEHAATH